MPFLSKDLPLPVRILAVLSVLVVGLLGALTLYDAILAPTPDYSPVLRPSVLDDWSPPWAAATPDPAEPDTGTDDDAEPDTAAGDDTDPKTGTDGEAEPDTGTDGDAGPDAATDGDAAVDPVQACNTLPSKWIVIGWDGADWDEVLPLLDAGRLPHLEALMRGGSYGTLASMIPTLSPAVWTTIATGRTPGRHGILHFYNQKPRLERWLERALNWGKLDRQLYSNADRRSRAVWNELSDRGRPVMLVGYHNTFPVEPVEGMMVSNYLVQDSIAQAMNFGSASTSAALATSLVYPQASLEEVLEIQREVDRRILDDVQRFADLDDDEVTDFVRRSRTLVDDADQKPYFLAKALTFDTLIAEVADAFYDEVKPDLAMIHFQSIDWAAHRFYYYHDPSLFESMPWTDAQRAALDAELDKYGDTLSAFYVYMDEWLGRFMARRDPETAILLLSDHGFETNDDPDLPGEHKTAPPGIVVMNGPGIRADQKLESDYSIYDILPTLMAGLSLPVAEDLQGTVMREAFCDAALTDVETVASYGDGKPYIPEIHRPEGVDAEVLKQLESLGYLN